MFDFHLLLTLVIKNISFHSKNHLNSKYYLRLDMKYAISLLSTVPIRRLDSDKSEMVSQLLFGEVVQIINDKDKSWWLIQCSWDGYIGWVSSNQLHLISEADYENYKSCRTTSAEIMAPAMCDGHSRYIPFGASLPDFDEMTFQVAGQHFAFGGRVTFPDRIENQQSYLQKMAQRLLHVPYLWGGRSSLGIDCSGFVQVLYKHLNISIPRDAYQQVEVGEMVDFVAAVQPGDLAFFRSHYSDKITHVGMILEKGKIIHASGRVRIDKLDHYGIFHLEEKRYTHLLVGIKRILPTIL